MKGQIFELEIRPKIPRRLRRLEELANDLYYSWDRDVRRLFRILDNDCWEACGHRPKVFLRRVPQARLDQAARDIVFLENYNRVLSAYDTHLREGVLGNDRGAKESDVRLVAFFCAEYGFHESFPIYSGGLGILAADYCKAISDLRYPFIAIGLLYHQGYFVQRLGPHGEQVEDYPIAGPQDLPVTPASDANGEPVRISVELPGRKLWLAVWRAKVGHIHLYLLDSDLPENSVADRSITCQLYGGDEETRIQQEIVLGIGGARALRGLGYQPNVWHLNEGHAAFVILERCRELIAGGLDLDSALEAVAAGTVFTSHTPVSAGHDIYPPDLVRHYLGPFAHHMGIEVESILQLGADPDHPQGLNMTALALRGSRAHNGVSAINGKVAGEMNRYLWPEIPPVENPFSHVTNGIHVPSFLGTAWVALFDMYFGRGWRSRLCDHQFWQEGIERIPDHVYLSTHRVLKAEMLSDLRTRLTHSLRRNGLNEPRIRRINRFLDPNATDTLVIGFARRFATYKRATLLFRNIERLRKIFSDSERPLVLVFAGKAHPKDEPGKQLIRDIHQISQRPEFEGRILLLEDYNLSMARALLAGVDVWLNTPRYPMEACGTSGMKAGINGVPNLSVLDGWWAEAFDGNNGWGITPHEPGPGIDHDWEDASELFDILETEVIGSYYSEGHRGDSPEWIARSKASMCTIMPAFNATRMVQDYIRDFYEPASRMRKAIFAGNFVPARELSAWKRRIRKHWSGVRLDLLAAIPSAVRYGDTLNLAIEVHLNGLSPDDLRVECLIGENDDVGGFTAQTTIRLSPTDPAPSGVASYRAELPTREAENGLSGLRHLKFRAYPYHAMLCHPFEIGLMRWL